MKVIALILFLTLFAPQFLLANQSTFVLKPKMERVSLNNSVYFLEDKTNELNIQDIVQPELQSQFFASKKNSFGYSNSTYWVRVLVKNPGKKELDWMLELDYSVFDHFEIYNQDEKLLGTGGDLQPFSNRGVAYRNIVFQLKQKPGQEKTYYLKLKSASSMTLPFFAYSVSEFHNKVSKEQMLFGLYYGIMLVMLIYNLFLFMATADRSYLYYSIYILFFVLFQATANGLTFQYLWPNSIWWANNSMPMLIFLAGTGGLYFSRKFLNSKEQTPFTFKLYYILFACSFVGIILSFALEYSIVIRLAVFMCFPYVLIIFINGFQCVIKGQRSARYFLIAWTAFLCGVVLYASKSFGLLPSNFLTTWSIQIGSAVEVVLLSFALADRINELSHNLEKRVDELHTAQAQIQESERRFRNLFDGADEFIFTLDGNLNFYSANQSLKRILGFNRDDIRGTNFFELLYKDENDKLNLLTAKEKVEKLITTSQSVVFKSSFRQKYVMEPRELRVRLQYLEHDNHREILGRAYRLEEDLMFRDMEKEKIVFSVNNLLSNVETLSQRLTTGLARFVDEDVTQNIKICVRETLINSIEHGNLAITFDQKTNAMKEESYFDLLKKRQNDPRYKDKKIKIEYTINNKLFGLRITDGGAGFDHRSVMKINPDDLNQDHVGHGRGIMMMREVFDVIKYNEPGNQIILIKYFDKKSTKF